MREMYRIRSVWERSIGAGEADWGRGLLAVWGSVWQWLPVLNGYNISVGITKRWRTRAAPAVAAPPLHCKNLGASQAAQVTEATFTHTR